MEHHPVTAARIVQSTPGPLATELGRLIAAHDWSSTSLGPIQTWPKYVRTIVATILRSPVPIVTMWNADGVMIYNDAYSKFAATRHPRLLGSKVREGWHEVAEFNDNIMKVVLAGGTLTYREQQLTLHRSGKAEKVWLNLDYSPVLDDDDVPAGVIAIVVEVTERVRAERQLKRERERFSHMFEQSPSFMSLKYGPEHRTEMVNATFRRLFPDHDMIGKPLRDAVPEIESQGLLEAIDATYRTGQRRDAIAWPLNIRRTPDGPLEERFFDLVYQPIRDEAGKIIGTFTQGNEVTDRVLAERQAREKEANFQAVAQMMPNHVWTARSDGGLDWINERALDYSRSPNSISPDELWSGDIHPEDRDRALAEWARARRSGEPYETEFRLRRHDGHYRWFLVRALPVRGANGAIERWVGTNTDIDGQKRAEAQTSRDRDRLWALSQELLVICDYDGLITAANPAVTRILGWEEREFVQHNILDFLHPQDLERSRAQLSRLVEGKNMHAFENRCRSKRGDYRIIEWAGVPDSGRIHSIGRDVTEERAAFRDRERSWTLSPVLKIVATVDGRMMAVNPAWTRVLGWSEAESLGRHVSEFLAPEGRDEGAHSMAQLAQGHRMTEYQTTSMTKSGERRRVAWTTVPEGDFLYGFGRDVTAEQQAAAALAASNIERERIWNTAHDLMGVIGGDARLKSINPAWSRLLGISPAELLSRPFLDFVLPDDRTRVAGIIANLTAGNSLREFEHRLVHTDGTASLISWSTEPIGDDSFYVVGRDVTEQRQAQEALRQSQKMEAVGQLTGGIAHDFNNLVQGITGNLDILQKRILQGRLDDLERFIQGARRAANRASALTHRLLAFSRRQPLDPKPVNANPLVASMEDLLRRTLGEHIELDFRLCEELWLTLCDPHQLENALLNLAINARDAMPHGGRLTIETANFRAEPGATLKRDMRPGEYASVSVADTGTGMSEDTVNKAFEPFFTTKPLGQGTGLGLSMVYGFARQSGGYVQLESELGRGTAAKLFLPRYEGNSEQEDPRREEGPTQAEAAGEAILIVEDEPLVRASIVEMLADLGYRLLEASDGPSGLEILQSSLRIDLLITDIGLPGLNGRQIADAARLRRPGLKVLFMTGYAENAAFGSELDVGMAMIAKPFAMEAVAAKVRSILSPPPQRNPRSDFRT